MSPQMQPSDESLIEELISSAEETFWTLPPYAADAEEAAQQAMEDRMVDLEIENITLKHEREAALYRCEVLSKLLAKKLKERDDANEDARWAWAKVDALADRLSRWRFYAGVLLILALVLGISR